MWKRRSPPFIRSTTIYLPLSAVCQLVPGKYDVQVFNVLETVAQVAEEGMIQVLEHAPLANDVADAFRAYNCDTTSAPVVLG